MRAFQSKAESIKVGEESVLTWAEEAEGAEPHFPGNSPKTVWNLEESLKEAGLEILCELEEGHKIRRFR